MFLCMSAVQGELGLENVQFSIFDHDFDTNLRLELETLNLDWDPHTCRYGYNTYLWLSNSYTITKYFALYHTCILAFSHVIEIKFIIKNTYKNLNLFLFHTEQLFYSVQLFHSLQLFHCLQHCRYLVFSMVYFHFYWFQVYLINFVII